jgi:hypothetical protein
MKSLLAATVPLLLMIAGCHDKPCTTSNECGSSEVCASQRCQALACDTTWFATDPSNGSCRPLPACGNRDDVRGWESCENPCGALGEHACISDPRCQPAYATTGAGTTCPQPVFGSAGSSANAGGLGTNDSPVCNDTTVRNFMACDANPLRVDPCAGKSDADCRADTRCVAENLALPTPPPACDCPADAPCSCGNDAGSGTRSFECRVRTCGDFRDAECAAHPECQAGGLAANGSGDIAPNTPVPPGVDPRFTNGCFPKGSGSCFSMDERTCLAHSECHPVGEICYCPANATCACGGGKFLFCEPDDGLHRCDSDTECGGDQRCSNDETCAPPVGGGFGGSGGFDPGAINDGTTGPAKGAPVPLTTPVAGCSGVCVPKGCTGYGEARCNADPTCAPHYLLQCTPYGGGNPAAFAPCGGPTGGGTTGAEGAPASSCGSCEPTFTHCSDLDGTVVIDPGKSVLLTVPSVVDAPVFAFPAVMSRLAGSADAAPFVTAWLSQITATQTISGRTAPARQGATQFLAQLPRRGDGLLDPGQLGFQVTSLSNRIDLAGPKDCGEARITYALKNGVTDRRHRMTVIVELHQPDDGAQCKTIAQQWIALSTLSGDALTQAAAAIYAPLLTPANLSQVRTNEFLVGPTTGDQKMDEPWELREWHLGGDGQLHLALSKQAVDPSVTQSAAFVSWAKDYSGALRNGTATVPDSFLAVISSENGSRVAFTTGAIDDRLVETAINKLACSGCHTTESNTAFAHVAERFGGTGRAQLSEFLTNELPGRSRRLARTAQGGLKLTDRYTVKPIH